MAQEKEQEPTGEEVGANPQGKQAEGENNEKI